MKIPHGWKEIDDDADAQRNVLGSVTAIWECATGTYDLCSKQLFCVPRKHTYSSAPETVYQRNE